MCFAEKGFKAGSLPIKNKFWGVSIVAQWLTNPTRNHEVAGSVPALAQWVNYPALPWLWRRPVATAPIGPLAWEPPYAAGAAQRNSKKDKKKKKELVMSALSTG